MRPVSIIHGLAMAGCALVIAGILAVWAWLHPEEARRADEAMRDHIEQE